MKQETIDKVLAQIVRDVEAGELCAIEELIAGISEEVGLSFLSEAYEDPSDYVGMGWVGQDGRP